jgi:protein-S-isoprenylcysteine O-methyltransferase Ste14
VSDTIVPDMAQKIGASLADAGASHAPTWFGYPPVQIIKEAAFRVVAVTCTGYFALGAATALYIDPTRIALLCLLLSASLDVVLLLFASMPKQRDCTPTVMLTACFICLYPLLLVVEPGIGLVPGWVTGALAAVGVGLNFWAKLSLGHSFALLPGVRTIVAKGPYRFVRHPIYAGFLLTIVCFLLNDFSLSNLCLLSLVFGAEFYRILREEALLRTVASYRAYCDRVRYRFIPGVV